MKHTINALIAGLCLFISAGASAAPAMPLSTVEILKVASNSGAVEDVSDGREQTKMQHRGPHIKVYVLERGYGGQPTVTFDGQIIDGVRTPVCNKGEGLVTCDGAGMDYRIGIIIEGDTRAMPDPACQVGKNFVGGVGFFGGIGQRNNRHAKRNSKI